jgi:hypothetical protein
MRPKDTPALEVLNDIPTAARKLGGVSIYTIRDWLSTGKLKRTKIGRRTMITDSAISQFIRNSNKEE